MKIISCSSYYGTGSSAVTDFVTEFSSVKSLGEYEFRFLHDIDGIADLEYHLVENHNRHNSGHALKGTRNLSTFTRATVSPAGMSRILVVVGKKFHTNILIL